MDVILTCPLGSKCEEAKDNKLYRCRWFQKLIGSNPQTEEYFDEYRCVFEWMNILSIENTKRTNEAGAAIESFRNIMTEQNEQFLSLANQNKINHE